MQLTSLICLLSGLLVLTGCTNVEPQERSFLALDHMRLDPNYLGSKFDRHLYAAREGIYGGYGAEASGCGCN